MNNTIRHPKCHMRTVLGNCDPIGGFCTSVNESICEALYKVSRPQGEWIGYEVPTRCSICGHDWDEYVMGQEIYYNGDVPNYCPNCGAKNEIKISPYSTVVGEPIEAAEGARMATVMMKDIMSKASKGIDDGNN